MWYRKEKKKKKSGERLNLLHKAKEIAKPGNELSFPKSGVLALTIQSSYLMVLLSF